MRYVTLVTFLAVATVMVLVAPVRALDATSELTLEMDGFRRMDSEEIRMLLTDRTVHLTYGRDDNETVYYFGPDGVRSSDRGGFRLDRHWMVSRDRLCEEYLRPLDFACSKVFVKNGVIQLCPEDENICWYIFSGFIPGDAEGLRNLAPLPSG